MIFLPHPGLITLPYKLCFIYYDTNLAPWVQVKDTTWVVRIHRTFNSMTLKPYNQLP